MKYKLVSSFIFIVFSICFVNAQNIKIKKGIVYVDDKECLTIGGDPNNVSFYDLNDNEIIFLKFIRDSKYGSLYTKITFLESKQSFTSKSYIFSKKLLIKKLIQDKTLENCLLIPEKVERFVLKYDENVEQDDINVNISIDRN
jgi:hypothetical protein